MYLIIIIFVFGGGMYLLFKYVQEHKENDIEVLEDDKSGYPKRAILRPDILLKYMEYCMTNSKMNKVIFYYLNKEHYFSIDLYNDKFIYKFDGIIYDSMGDVINEALINKGRIANNHDPFTITNIINLKDNSELDITNEEIIKDYIVDGYNKDYDLNIKI